MLCHCNGLHLISVSLTFLHKADQAFPFLTPFYFLKPRRASYFKYNNMWMACHGPQLPCDLVYLSALCLNLKLPRSLSPYSLLLTCSYMASQGFLSYQSVLCSINLFTYHQKDPLTSLISILHH